MAQIKEFKKPVNDSLVEWLENLLQQAKDGEINGMCAMFQTRELGQRYVTCAVDDRWKEVGLLEQIKTNLLTQE